MRILMLGWEFPPFVSGGLGTACFGLTRALDRMGHQVTFVLPRGVDRAIQTHVKLLGPQAVAAPSNPLAIQAQRAAMEIAGLREPVPTTGAGAIATGAIAADLTGLGLSNTRLVGVPAAFSSPYPGGRKVGTPRRVTITGPDGMPIEVDTDEMDESHATHGNATFAAHGAGAGPGYRGDLVAESERYARLVVALCRNEEFDVVHAHDWLTFPAGQALSRVTGKPLVVHVHSTEFDRAGEHPNQRVYDIERRGMMAAMRVVAVSELTQSLCIRRYGVPTSKIDVVYNGVDNDHQPPAGAGIRGKDKVVLFLGRITMQKGPEYFIAAARRVLEKVPDAKFIMAGSGDMELRMIELAAHYGIGHRVLFTGFLRGADVDRIFRMADCYVMPSVSEPFGIAPLEAMRNDVPVIVSRTSGVSEVVQHVLKVDFWDIDEMANKIVAVLRHPPLGQTMREHGSFEVRKLTWDTSAEGVLRAYDKATAGQRELLGV